jgi:hypothetical protein
MKKVRRKGGLFLFRRPMCRVCPEAGMRGHSAKPADTNVSTSASELCQ